jgi:UDP-glucose:glycoprotein glucosyltransferase
MRYIRRNLFNVLFVIDLSSLKGLEIIDEVKLFIERNIPIRFGLIPLVAKEKNECKWSLIMLILS